MLQPNVRRTWAPVGQTPIQCCSASHGRVSVVSALTVSPLRHRLGLYFHLQRKNLRWPELVRFFMVIRRAVGRRIIFILDRSSPHRSAVGRIIGKVKGIEVEWLPAYAPDLNPVEQVWNHTKDSDLANYIPEDIEQLNNAVRYSLKKKRTNQNLLRSFFKVAQLEI